MNKKFVEKNWGYILLTMSFGLIGMTGTNKQPEGFVVGLMAGLIISAISIGMNGKDQVIARITKADQSNKKSYHLGGFKYVFRKTKGRLTFELFVVIFYGYLAINHILKPDSSLFTIIVIFCESFLCVYLALILVYERLVFTENGIEYYFPLYKLVASWDQLLEVARLNRGQYVLICKTATQVFWGKRITINQEVPLLPFSAENWKTHEVRKIIEVHAPQLKFFDQPELVH